MKFGGYTGKFLRVDLTAGTSRVELIPEDIIREYIGARGFGIKYLYDEMTPGIDPLSPENKLILLTGPLCGTTAQGCSKWIAITKSPVTGGFFRSVGGGRWGHSLKSAGFDFIILEGRAAKPSYINIEDEKVDVADARDLWGLNTVDTQERLRGRHGPKTQTACIGPSGEKMVMYAAIVSDRRTASRGGVGTVMGSKNLKAIAINGSGKITTYQKEAFNKLVQKQISVLKPNAHRKLLSEKGIACSVRKHYYDRMQSPVRNFQETVFEGIESLFPEEYYKYKVKSYACWGCMTKCGKWRRVTEGPYAGAMSEGPEYEGGAVLGPLLGNSDLAFTIAGDELCDLYGIDVISTAVSIAFACELFEKGIINTEDTDGLDLTWGNHSAFYDLIEKIGKREGFGEILGQGTRLAAAKIGRGAEKYAMQVKGIELPAYEPRAIKGYALSYAVSNIGGSHMYARPFREVNLEADPTSEDLWKAEEIVTEQKRLVVWDCAMICPFGQAGIEPFGNESAQLHYNMLAEATGVEEFADHAYLEKAAEKIITLERAFNVREGFSRKDDTLPLRFTTEPIRNAGPYTGEVVSNLDGLIDEYYRLMGYTREGIPTSDRLERLGLQSIAQDMMEGATT
ncbi:aldehyde ferredoxin oxidoreductase family protein [Thermodesulfobacteriota bacterium]